MIATLRRKGLAICRDFWDKGISSVYRERPASAGRQQTAHRYVFLSLIGRLVVFTIEEMPPADGSLMPSVLVVDDDISLRPMLAAWVNRFGFSATEADCAEAALAALSKKPTHIAVCDVNMPGRDGVWLASQIRERFPATAVIMATSVDDSDVAVSTLRNDVVDYLLKPFDSVRLREALALGLDWHRAALGDGDLHHALQD